MTILNFQDKKFQDKSREIKIENNKLRNKDTKMDALTILKEKCNKWVDNMCETHDTTTKPGSIKYLLYGRERSEQAINIKLGRLGEFMIKEFIELSELDLLPCGIQNVNGKKKDIDLVFIDENSKILYYREMKGNIQLDTEKLPATISKCKEITSSLEILYPDYTIDCGILNWSVYNRKILTEGLSNIKTFEKNGIKIDHMEDFLNIINIVWSESDFYSYFRELGIKIRSKD